MNWYFLVNYLLPIQYLSSLPWEIPLDWQTFLSLFSELTTPYSLPPKHEGSDVEDIFLRVAHKHTFTDGADESVVKQSWYCTTNVWNFEPERSGIPALFTSYLTLNKLFNISVL